VTATTRSSAERDPIDRLATRQLVGQAVILSFDGYQAPAYVLRALREGRVAGVILFTDNVASPQQLRKLTGSLQRAAGGSALVMTDQEGGPVRILPFAPPDEGSSAQSTSDEAREQAVAAARALRGHGVNVNLAPVADVPSVAGAALAGRAYSGDAATVASRVRAAVRAYGRERVGTTAKHFPGLGAATANTDDAPVTVSGPTRQDLEPFRAAIAAGTALVMASHALYPDIDDRRIASQSPAILSELLRERLGFRGVIVTDSMEAEAVLDRSDVPTAAERSLLAGADLLLLTGSGSFRPVSQRLNAAAARSSGVRARLRESALRVVALKRSLGLAVPPAMRQPR
jgi:beta-N-acetylhexosaminidase